MSPVKPLTREFQRGIYLPPHQNRSKKEVSTLNQPATAARQTPEEFAQKRQLALQLLQQVAVATRNGYYHAGDDLYVGTLQMLENGRSLSVIIDVDPKNAAKRT